MKMRLQMIAFVLFVISAYAAEVNAGSGSGADTSGGQTVACAVEQLAGRTYSGSGMTIRFLNNREADFVLALGDQCRRFYDAFAENCLVVIRNNCLPALPAEKSFVLHFDLSAMVDLSDYSIVLWYEGDSSRPVR